MVVLVPGERQAVPLDRIGDEQRRPVVRRRRERRHQRRDAVAAEVGHDVGERGIVEARQQLGDVRPLADVGGQPRAPRRPALVGQRGEVDVRAGVDPFAQAGAAGQRECRLLLAAILERQDAPAARLEDVVEAAERRERFGRMIVTSDHPATRFG